VEHHLTLPLQQNFSFLGHALFALYVLVVFLDEKIALQELRFDWMCAVQLLSTLPS